MTRQHQFRDLKAQTLWCNVCRGERQVRERLLLVLPDHDLHEYRCTACNASVGTRKTTRGGGGIVRG